MYNDNDGSVLSQDLSIASTSAMSKAATYGKAIAIVSLISLILGAITNITTAIKVPAMMGTNIFSLLISCLIGGLLIYFMMGFANKTKKGLAANDANMVQDGMCSLLNYFKVIGILLIIIFGIVVIGLVIAIIAALVR